METKKCYVCNKKHEEESYRWKRKRIGNKRVWYCHSGIDCAGCGFLHFNDTYKARMTADGKAYCGKWFSSSSTPQQRMKNMSPEEVLSGSHYGLPNQFGRQSEDYTPQVKQGQRKEVLDALK